MADLADDNPLWRFSVGVYRQLGVADGLLGLQDRFGLDVNLLLCCCFAALRGCRMTATDIAALDAAGRPWREHLVLPLRTARRWLKPHATTAAARSAREQVLAAELAAERLVQDAMLAALPADVGPGPMAVAHDLVALANHNVAACLRHAGVEAASRPARALVDAIFPEHAAAAIVAGRTDDTGPTEGSR